MPIVCSSLGPNVPGNPSTFRISEPNLLLVEGKDDQAIFEQIAFAASLVSLQIIDMQGKSDWRGKVRGIAAAAEFRNVTTLGLVRDADDDPGSAAASIKGALQGNGLPVPERSLEVAQQAAIKTSFLIVPDDGLNGELETLALSSLPPDVLACVDDHFNCVARTGQPVSSDLTKAKVQVWLGSRNGPCPTLAIAARRQLLDLASSAFDPLRSLLRLFV